MPAMTLWKNCNLLFHAGYSILFKGDNTSTNYGGVFG